jgi:hypothetical protein
MRTVEGDRAPARPRLAGRDAIFEVVALLLVIGVAISMVGACVSAAGVPSIGIIDTWGRIDEAASRIASWEYVAAVAGAVLFLVLACAGERAPTRRSRRVAVAITVELALLAVGAAIGIPALTQRQAVPSDFQGFVTERYYTNGEQLGETVVYVGLLVAIAGLFLVVRPLLSRNRSRRDGEPSSTMQ